MSVKVRGTDVRTDGPTVTVESFVLKKNNMLLSKLDVK